MWKLGENVFFACRVLLHVVWWTQNNRAMPDFGSSRKLAIFINPTQIWLRPECGRISAFGQICKMAHTNTAVFCISVYCWKIAQSILRYFQFVRLLCWDLVISRLTRSCIMNILSICQIYAVSSFMTKSQIRLRLDLCCQIWPNIAPVGLTKPESGTALQNKHIVKVIEVYWFTVVRNSDFTHL